ncbi:RNA polymerase-associated protein RapA [Allorhodopirellula solitaria]|uniref:RNA polymerase-associated protein RapA n=1 Tax=Allorhodopirellula solitaria TaxID=2527987 RepID=A0A5C5WQE3_9BACT|nr:RNA polymerase-associated protein RapA [Allorhodopirellula solitaria]
MNGLGIGKVTSIDGDKAIVEYFRSPVDDGPIRRETATKSLSRRELLPETRAYFRNPETDSIEIGRVQDYQQDDQLYLVRFPNDQPRMLSSDEFEVRCRMPISEPTEHLASQVNETAFWHEARSGFVKHLLEQHCTSAGLSALLSSSVEIVAHQVSVVRRVLMDPFQRYLLADEVGLGKTIEAGVLIKQFTLDEPLDHQTVIIVPKALLLQWKQELTHRFHLGSKLGVSVHIVSSEDQDAIAASLADARMIVVDEAHHLSSWAWSSDSVEREIFQAVANTTRDLYRRVLLLSATPVLHNEQSFLAMLHLLDPQVYPLDSLETFKQRVQLRQEIAERMMDLREDEQNFFLGDTLEVLGDLLPDDREFQELRTELGQLVEQDVEESDPRRCELIRSIRTHVSDMWRLHRRILRNRRTDATAAYLPGRGGAKRVVYVCENEAGLAEAIEGWRLTLSASLFSADETEKQTASELARVMDELASCEPRHALDFATARLNGGGSATVSWLPLCKGESDSLQQIIRAAKDCDHAARLQKLYQIVGSDDDQISFVIFASSPETADLVFEFLELRLPAGRVLRHSAERSSWIQFKNVQRGYVLVCDRAAEEGLNLQKRGAFAIHYDLPFSPNRIEQRMGRLDRFGSGISVQSVVLVCDGSRVQKRWFDLVDGGLGVFHRSIASLQYVIEDVMRRILQAFLDSGSDAFAEAVETLCGEEGLVATELKRITAQDSIDSFDADAVTQEFADELEDSDRRLGEGSAKVFHNWLVRNLHFGQTGEEKRHDEVFSYEFTRKIDVGRRYPKGRDTLIPVDEFKRRFSHSLEELRPEPPAEMVTEPLTFDRVTSQRRSCRLLRVGDPFVDAMEAFTRWDDRGCSYAFWRYAPSYRGEEDPAVFFKFNYVVSPALAPLKSLCQRFNGASWVAVMRRCETIMQPLFTRMFLDADLTRVMPSDERMNWIRPEYNKDRTTIGKDFNLNRGRWDTAAELYDMSLWRDRCVAARETSERLLREDSTLPKRSAEWVETARNQASQVQQQFRSRLAMTNGESKSSLELDLQFETELLEAQIEAFTNPDLRVDSVGAIFVSSQMPFVENDEVEDDD